LFFNCQQPGFNHPDLPGDVSFRARRCAPPPTLRGRSFCATRNASIEHGNPAAIAFPLAMTVCESIIIVQKHPTTNIEHSTSNFRGECALGVGRWMFDVECFSIYAVKAASQSFQTGS
jgi:hypothetical protein